MPAQLDKHVEAAIARLPGQSTGDVETIMGRAKAIGAETLVAACSRELALRPRAFSADQAKASQAMAAAVQGKSLAEAIRYAFTFVRPPDAGEMRVIRWLAAHPGGTFEQASADYGKGDLSLVIGHLVYERFGCFRKFMQPGEDQSSILITKDRQGNRSVRYTLKAEAEAVFREIGIL